MKKYFFTIIISFLGLGLYSQEFISNHSGDYLGQTPPTDSAIIFAPEIISITNRGEYALAISPNHDEYFYNAGRSEDTSQIYGLLRIKRVGDSWLKPQKANLNQEGFWEQEAFYSPDGNSIYYAVSDSGNTKIWISNKTRIGWSKGERLNSLINDSAKRIFYTTFSKNGNLYYTNVDELKIYMSENNSGTYNSFNEIGLPRAGHAYIAPNEDFIIFDSRQADNYGKTDIYIAFKKNNGSWGEPINLGPQVNTEYLETCPSLSPDGKYIFFGRYNDENEKSNIYWISSEIINKLREKNIEPYKILKGHKHKVQNAFYSSDGKLIVSHGWDNTVKIWDAETFSEIRTFEGHTDQVWCAIISRDNKLIASGSLDRSFILWDVETGEKISQVQINPLNVIIDGMIPEFDMELPNSIYKLSFHPNEKFLALASADKLVRIWDVENSVFVDTLARHNTSWTWVKYSPDGKYLISGSGDRSGAKGETIIWETGSYNQIRKINSSGVIFFTDKNEFGIYQGDCTMDYFDLSSGEFIYTKPFPCFEGYGDISFDKKYIASCNEDYCIRLWDVETQEMIWKYKGELKEIQRASFSPDGKYLIAGTPESDILIWKLEDILNNID